ncbi:hypothetical protein RUM43_014433 [Polyplax serrata]|uniref:Phosphodiesterase n=1 Tax=Polyplax serrata TaxID=468196 RepID=A0AAN8NQI9_POLSC
MTKTHPNNQINTHRRTEKEISKSTIDWLKQPSFDSSQYDDEEILLFIQHMFLELGLITKFDIRLPVLRNFLYEVYKNYNEVPFHNFRHCFCVAQMMYVMIWSVDIPNKMGDLDTLILLTACICHDLDHPGYNNIYQINARTELALLYNDISPLENHHCSVAFRILENPDCNIFASLDKETFKEIREGIIRCILATDMARHNEILTQFKDVISEFDFSNKAHKNLLSMILIKVADISNEARPMNVAEPWLDRLLTEFFKQSDAEKQEGLPVTPFMDRDKITKPSSQCSFIGFVLLPLFEALGELLPQLHDLIIAPAKFALEHYRRLNEAAKDERMRRKSVAEGTNLENYDYPENSGMVKSGSGHSTRQRSRSSEDFEPDTSPPLSPGAFSNLLEDLENVDEQEELDEEDLEEETVTEVEVSEKTLKFKISTEGTSTSCPGRKSCPGNWPGSRKGSRERNQYFENELDWSRDEDGKFLKRSTTSDTMSSSKGSSDSEKVYMDKTSRKGSGGSDRGDEKCKSTRQKDYGKSKTSCYGNKYEYRRKSLAVVERPRTRETGMRRSSISHDKTMRGPLSTRIPTKVVNPVKESEQQHQHQHQHQQKKKELEESILDKLENGECESRCSREFETSCWGLQNLKKGSTLNQDPVTSSNVFVNSKRKSIGSEKSKSEDNLTIMTSEMDDRNMLVNNLNVSKTEESIEKQLSGGIERKKKIDSTGHLSILSRLKHLREKMTFGRESENSSEVNSPNQMGPNFREKTGKSNCDNQNPSKECEDDFERSRTLPKARKPNRTTSGRMKKGWRALIRKSEGNSSSSLDVPPSPGSPSPVRASPRRKSSTEDAKPARTKFGETSSSGSLGEKKKSLVWLPSPKKSGLLGLIGSRSQEEENSSGRHNFLNNLTSSFRKKGSKNDEENGASSSSSLQDGSKPN